LTGHIRATENPNRIVQDGKKIPFLCKECETLFSGWESYFSQNIFHPYQNDEKDSFDYDYRLSKFLASVSFRVLLYSFENDKNDFFDSPILKHAPIAINNLKNTYWEIIHILKNSDSLWFFLIKRRMKLTIRICI
jgi:hypothetical protein